MNIYTTYNITLTCGSGVVVVLTAKLNNLYTSLQNKQSTNK